MKLINARNRSVLIISDTHAPYIHKDAYKFLRAIKRELLDDNSIILHSGDEVDNHAISMHPSDCDLMSAGDELKEACSYMQGLENIFERICFLDSNHGSLAIRRFKLHGIPLQYLKSLNQVYGVSKKWSWHEDIILETKIGKVYLCHGKSSVYGKLAKEQGCSAIQGHYHGKFEITWHQSALSQRFNIFVGCLIDRESLAFAYGKNHIPKPILGVGMLTKEGYPKLVKMDLDAKGRWTGKLK